METEEENKVWNADSSLLFIVYFYLSMTVFSVYIYFYLHLLV